jgi:hypothetical protein
VIREIGIWRVAVLMVNRYADAAEAKADRCADELRPKGEPRRSAPKLEAEGDHAGAAIWRRVTVAISGLQTRLDHRTNIDPIARHELSRTRGVRWRRRPATPALPPG